MSQPIRPSTAAQTAEEIKAESLKRRSPSALELPSPRMHLKRKRSEMASITPSQSTVDLANMSLSRAETASPPTLSTPVLPPYNPNTNTIPEPPSPVPTEIIDVDAEDFVRTSKEYGVKVRDFAYESPEPGSSKVPEIWRSPFFSLLSHDVHIRRPKDREFELPGKVLRRLLEVNFVTEEEAQRHWTEEDWRKVKAYDERPQGPYPYCVAMKRPKPSAKYRVTARHQYYGQPLADDIPDSAIYIPEDGPDVWEGDKESRALGKMLKKRRLVSVERMKESARVELGSTPQLSSSQWSDSASQALSESCQEPESSELPSPSQPHTPLQDLSQPHLDADATPPVTPVALPETASLGASPSFSNISPTSGSVSSVGDSNVPHSRRIRRTATLSMLMVR